MLINKKINPKFGAELRTELKLIEFSDTDIDELISLVASAGVVVARNQVMTTEDQADFAHRLGSPLLKPNNPPELRPELIKIETNADSQYAAGQIWHSDVSSEPEPPGVSMLRMEVVPEAGGDTVFANMYQAFETLSNPIQKLLIELSAYHSPKSHYLYTSGACRLDELPISLHPIVRIHPVTKRRALFVNEGFVEAIADLKAGESRALLRMLYDHVAYSTNIQCRISWQPNTVVFWDNRCVQHHASFDYYPKIRLGYRVTLKGEKPIPA